jgi:hypothetical protein
VTSAFLLLLLLAVALIVVVASTRSSRRSSPREVLGPDELGRRIEAGRQRTAALRQHTADDAGFRYTTQPHDDIPRAR